MATMLVVGLGVPSGLASQERDWDRLGDRIARAVEHALEQAGRATEQALQALENLELEMDWEAGAWSWDDEDAGPRVQEEFRWAGVVDAGDVLEIKGVNGPISATPASGREVEVVAVKSGRRSDPANVTIDVVEHAGGVTLCAIYPTPEGDRANECGVGEDGRNRVRRNDVRVSWEIRVPRGVAFRGRTVNGGIEAIGLGAEVDVETVNGDVVIETTGFAAARTVNGSIEARMDGDPLENVSFETVNGSIRLDVADGIDADLDASWLNGSLETEIPFQVRGRMGRRSAEGTLGEGGATLRLRTVNGSIRIH
jgi:hypothetical protein